MPRRGGSKGHWELGSSEAHTCRRRREAVEETFETAGVEVVVVVKEVLFLPCRLLDAWVLRKDVEELRGAALLLAEDEEEVGATFAELVRPILLGPVLLTAVETGGPGGNTADDKKR